MKNTKQMVYISVMFQAQSINGSLSKKVFGRHSVPVHRTRPVEREPYDWTVRNYLMRFLSFLFYQCMRT